MLVWFNASGPCSFIRFDLLYFVLGNLQNLEKTREIQASRTIQEIQACEMRIQ